MSTPATPSNDRPRHWRPTQPVARGLLLSAALLLAFAALTWFVAGPLKGFRIDQSLNRPYPTHNFIGLLHVLDRIGQRAVCLPILGVVTAVMAWRHRSARPILVAVVGVIGVNLAVLIFKLWLGRGAPYDHQPSFWIDGQMYPSGHAANIVASYGLGAYLLSHYGLVRRRVRTFLLTGVGVLCVIMTMTSMLLRWHWFSDLIGGYLVGGAILAATAGIDAAVPFRSRRLVIVPPDEVDEHPDPVTSGVPVTPPRETAVD